MRDLFFEKVFFAWNSDDNMIAMPVLNVKKLKETSVAAGYFIKNLPVTPSKQKQGQDFQTNPHRMANASAYLNKDESGLTVSAEFVRFKDGYTMAKAIDAAIVNWDMRERTRVDEYNSELIISLARMHTVRFAKDGTDHPPHIPHELQVNNRTLKCQLISDDFEEHYNMVKAVENGLSS
ncbi:uncharacterized protein FMAN_04191 [Fusarium mangiferae]|uniref:Uncharacterized protein n=1 Tax=Fusarium mangiferae TaxID=192010 RepID=A0A1L7SSW5_FUSMA|nr:uncharacterized protein FMAN_04191 [Fusarium mangiferae]CVK89640.1 uncharacterized protein FMAN_04191 [Fusarium mangiferae]